jgi:hypothetical protein
MKIIKPLIILLFLSTIFTPMVSSNVSMPLNDLPTVDATLTGSVKRLYLDYYKYDFTITADVDDPENQLLNIEFYYRVDVGDRWTFIKEYYGFDGIYKCEQSFVEQGLHDKTIYWMVEIIDGLDGFYYYYDYTIEV